MSKDPQPEEDTARLIAVTHQQPLVMLIIEGEEGETHFMSMVTLLSCHLQPESET
jgi:hypothetical protein